MTIIAAFVLAVAVMFVGLVALATWSFDPVEERVAGTFKATVIVLCTMSIGHGAVQSAKYLLGY